MASSGSLFRAYLDYPYGKSNTQRLYTQAKASLDVVQRLKLETKLDVHNGCVNTICWNEAGTLILSGSDDQYLCITDPFTKCNVSIQSGHLANIFSAKFLPNTQDNQVVSCSGDGMIQYTIVDRPDQYGGHPFDCHFGTTYELVTVPQDCNTFLSCGEDSTVRWFDLRIKDTCIKDECKEDILINCRCPVTALAINPLIPYQLSVGCSDSTVRIFDRRMLGTRATGNYTGRSSLTGMVSRFTAPLLEGHSHRVTSLAYSTDGTEVLASYSSEQLYLFNLTEDGSKEFQSDVIKTPQQLQKGATGNITSSHSPQYLSIKRLRLRGDWSDTGPNARPERERSPNPAAPAAEDAAAEGTDEVADGEAEAASAPPTPAPVHGAPAEPRSVTIMQRMSDMLTRWLEGASRQADHHRGTTADNPPAADAPVTTDNQPSALEETPGNGRREEAEETHGPDSEPGTSATAVGSDTKQQEGTSPKVEAEIPEAAKGGDEEKSVENSSNDCKVLEKGVEKAISQSQAVSQSVIERKGESQEGLLLPEPSLADNSQSLGLTAARQQEVEPLVSLRYSRESTSAATITMDFPESGTAGGPNLPPEVCAYSTPERRISPPKVTSSASMSPLEISVSASKSDAEVTCSTALSSVQVAVSESRSNVELKTSASNPSVEVKTSASKSTVAAPGSASKSSLEVEANVSKSPVEVLESASKSPVEVHSSTSKSIVEGTANALTVNEEVKTGASRLATEERSETEIQFVQPLNILGAFGDLEVITLTDDHSDSVNLPLSLTETKKSSEPTYLDISAASTSKDDHTACTLVDNIASASHVVDSENKTASGKEKPDVSHTLKYSPSDDDESPTVDPPGGSSEPAEPPGGNDDMPHRLASANRGRSGSSGDVVVPPVGGRQRRHGRSGPPTGDFQLHSASDDDSDDELINTSSSTHRERSDAERNRAATRLQEMYRKRLEEREQEEQQLMNIHQPRLKQVYRGHRNARTMIKEATFWGDEFVMSGSDCGHIFVWDRHTAELVMLLEGDNHVVNCLQPHPMDPVLASSGIDYDIKVWMPTEETPSFDTVKAEELMSRNRVMLEETRDTITVPASFMLRMLASLNHIRSGRRQGEGNASSSSDEE